MRIVKFKDGLFGIRRRMMGFEFLDLRDEIYWWSKYEFVEEYCKGTLDQCKEVHDKQKQKPDYGKPIIKWFS